MDRDRAAQAGDSPWWGEANVYCFTSGFDRAQAAWKNWLESLSGRRAGRRAGYPRSMIRGGQEPPQKRHVAARVQTG
ncbi:hypothetical protein AB0N93_35985 [Streptomyces sp. NPDC091267]|uniref:hypothetical protein n=1 Tax=Streptomyces sp. NPDC091267 TaxID=3155195 RepID=UPI00341595CF